MHMAMHCIHYITLQIHHEVLKSKSIASVVENQYLPTI